MNTALQFRVLYRQFLFRLMDVELLSGSAGGDASGLLGQFGALLVFGSVVLSFGSITLGQEIQRAAVAPPLWTVERLLISLNMLMVGIFAVLNWDATFLDRRDVLVLAPLPIRGRTLFAAKIAASGAALGITVAAFDCLAGFAWPVMLAPRTFGIAETARFIVAFWITLFAAGAFLYCAILFVQALAAQLPRRWYLRASPILQMGALVLFLGVLFLQPGYSTAKELTAPESQGAMEWLPSYWFMGLLSELSGAFPAQSHAVLAPLARRALANLGIAILAAAGAYVLSYFRTLRKIVEQPDIVPGSRGGMWLPRFGSLPETAIAQFAIRTVLRSRGHRMIVAFYLGGGFAIVAIYLGGARAVMHLNGIDILRRVNAPMLASSVLILCTAWLGTRTVFSLPLDLRANWLFRVTPSPGSPACLSGARCALLALSAVPVAASSTLLLVWFWPWMAVAEHLLILGLLGSILADVSLRGFRKIPFTCSYLPGKSKVHMVFWFGLIPVVIAIHKAMQFEQSAMQSGLVYCSVVATLAAAACAARVVGNATARQTASTIQFEEAADELIELRL
jgi:hypothetical protein